MTDTFITTKSLLERLNRELPSMIKYNVESVLEYIWESISLIKGIRQLLPITITVQLENYRCALPTNIERIMYVRYSETYLMYVQNSTKTEQPLVYSINNGYIYSDLKDKELEIDALIFPVDEEGYPMIPDNIYYIKAVLAYITERLFKKAYLEDRISVNKYRAAEQDWLFYVNSARVSQLMPNVDEDLRMTNNMLKLFPMVHRYTTQKQSTFIPISGKELLTIYNSQ